MQETPGNEVGAVEPPVGVGTGTSPCEEQYSSPDAEERPEPGRGRAAGFSLSSYYY